MRNYLNITFLMLSMLAISACGNGGSGGTKAEPFSQLKNGALILNNDVSYVDRNNLRFKAFGMHTDGLAYEVNTRKGTMFVAPILSNGEYGLKYKGTMFTEVNEYSDCMHFTNNDESGKTRYSICKALSDITKEANEYFGNGSSYNAQISNGQLFLEVHDMGGGLSGYVDKKFLFYLKDAS